MIGAYLFFLNAILCTIWIVWGQTHLLWVVCGTILIAILSGYGFYKFQYSQKKLLLKINDGLKSLQDGNFAVSLVGDDSSSHQSMVELFNATANKLRKERQFLYQRELLLDKMMNSANVAMVIVDHRGIVSFANQTSQHLFVEEEDIQGAQWNSLLARYFPELENELVLHKGALINVDSQDKNFAIWHVFKEKIALHSLPNSLYIFKPVTEEIARQELKTWKKVIRVISHELNNSIAPISTMCHNGKLLASTLDEPHLDRVFNTISSRINRLAKFVRNYSDLAKKNQPQKESVSLNILLGDLMALYPFEQSHQWDEAVILADPSQLEQVFINLLKNAREATPDARVVVSIAEFSNDKVVVTVQDDGPGIPETMLNEMMLPFRTTKPEGSGIGLSICKDIIDEHFGSITIKNNAQSMGLCVEVVLPK